MQSRKFLEGNGKNFLIQILGVLPKGGVLLNVLLTDKKELVGVFFLRIFGRECEYFFVLKNCIFPCRNIKLLSYVNKVFKCKELIQAWKKGGMPILIHIPFNPDHSMILKKSKKQKLKLSNKRFLFNPPVN